VLSSLWFLVTQAAWVPSCGEEVLNRKPPPNPSPKSSGNRSKAQKNSFNEITKEKFSNLNKVSTKVQEAYRA